MARAATQGRKRSTAAGAEPPPFQPVQLAKLVDRVPEGKAWLHELKFDGYRSLVSLGGGQAHAFTRSGLDWSEKFAAGVEDVLTLPVESALIDGEVVVIDDDGRTNFQALQAAIKGAPARLEFYAFDLLQLDGEDLTGLPLIERKERLARLLDGHEGVIHYSDHIVGQGEALFDKFCGAGLEGVISKRADSKYMGSRGGSWLKTKCIRRQEFVVVGWTTSDKGRGFRSLILGVNEDGRLRYAGKVGTGFDNAEIIRLGEVMEPLAVKEPTVAAPRSEVRGARWIRPKLVAEIAFTEMTTEGTLRHPSYLGMREDKKPEAVVVEKAASVQQVEAAAPSSVAISNRDRVIDPDGGTTKGQLADHYAAVAPIMLPWAGSRPISLVRCPQGRAKKCFFQKHDAGTFGDHVHHVAISEKDGHEEPYLYVDDADGLLTCVQMGTIEFHGWGARIEDVEKADRLVFDLDPDEGLTFEAVRSGGWAARHPAG
jgi:bifunctional non-homologous end joining protein LigD